jgi:hypothetical protein
MVALAGEQGHPLPARHPGLWDAVERLRRLADPSDVGKFRTRPGRAATSGGTVPRAAKAFDHRPTYDVFSQPPPDGLLR